MASNASEQLPPENPAAANGKSGDSSDDEPSWEYQLRKYLMLLATLVATATYSAGLAPPGGVWQKNIGDHVAGDPVLYDTGKPRYLAFHYCNATAFAASLVVNLLLLVLDDRSKVGLGALRLVMVLDLLGLLGAYAAGSCRDLATTVFASVLVAVLAVYVGVQILLASLTTSPCWQVKLSDTPADQHPAGDALQRKEQRKVLMLLATFAVGITYAAGLSPPGGFRGDGDAPHRAGDAVLQDVYKARLLAFFYCNTTAFVASLFIVVLLLSRRLQRASADWAHSVALYVFILVALFGLLGAYAAGSCRRPKRTAYVLALVGAVLVYVFLAVVVRVLATGPVKNSASNTWKWLQGRACCQGDQYNTETKQISGNGQGNIPLERELSRRPPRNIDGVVETTKKTEGLEKAKSLVLLLATLAATITYQAGLHPPGGVWPEDDEQHRYKAGDPILFSTHPKHYRAFFYCNSTAFVASLVVILMVQSKTLLMRHTLEAAMILDLLGLIGAYAAGSCRDLSTSIYTMGLAGAILVYVVIHMVFFTLDNNDMSDENSKKLEKRRKRLLLLAIMVATVTYQAGLTPPGGFWEEGHRRHRAGSSVLHDNYRSRYTAFFYCNATSFMASMSLIILLVNPNLYRPGIRCYALYVCMVVALLGLMGGYAAGSARDVRMSIYVFVLVGAVIMFVVVQVLVFLNFYSMNKKCRESCSSGTRGSRSGNMSNESPSAGGGGGGDNTEESSRQKYLMLLAILAASVTYQAGLDPPGGVWQAGENAGKPMMDYSNQPRYHAFLSCNSFSFVASIVVIILLLQQSLLQLSLENHALLEQYPHLLHAMNTAIVLDLLGLLGAYAAGSNREWETSGYVIALVAAVMVYIMIHLALWFLNTRRRQRVGSNRQSAQPSEQGDNHAQAGEA